MSRSGSPNAVRRRSRRAKTGLLLVCAAAACAREADAPPPPREDAHFLLHSDEPVVREHALGPADAADLLVVEEFGGGDPQHWTCVDDAGEPLANAAPKRTVVRDETAVALVPATAHACVATFDVAREDALAVRVRARSFATDEVAMVTVRELCDDAPADPAVARALPTRDGFVVTSLLLDRRRARRALRIQLVPGDGALAIDRIEVRALRPVEREWLVAHGGEGATLPRVRERVTTATEDQVVEGCLVPTGGRIRWRTHVDPGARLELATGLLGGDRGGRAEWTLSADGVVTAQRRGAVADGAWASPLEPWAVALDAWAGRDVTLELACSGDRSVVALAATPRTCGGAPRDERPDVVLLSLDTLRPDRTGPRAGGASLTPRLDELASRGARFSEACSTSSWTLPSHVSLFTGQNPLVHGVVDVDDRIDPKRSPLLARRFQRAGWATAAFTGGVLLDPHFGFAEGFELYSVRDPCEKAAFAPVTQWVEHHADGPFFLFLHTYCIHDYRMPGDTPDEIAALTALYPRAKSGDRAALAAFARRYDDNVRRADRDVVGGVLDLLDRLDLRRRTLVAVVSDHGEEFGEHGSFGHASTLEDEVASVVLVLAGPGVPTATCIDHRVSLLDVGGTLARLAGLPPEADAGGVDLFAPAPDPPRAFVLDLERSTLQIEALWWGDWRLERNFTVAAGGDEIRCERFDRRSGKMVGVPSTAPQVEALTRRLEVEVASRRERAARRSGATGRALPSDLRQRLSQFGYLDR
jgi:hypothetical protein